jgi:hypothetical protein
LECLSTEELPKILNPSPLVLITVSHLRKFLFGRREDRQTVGMEQWVSKFCKQVTDNPHKVYWERKSKYNSNIKRQDNYLN